MQFEKIGDVRFFKLSEEKHDIIQGLNQGMKNHPWRWVMVEESPERMVIEVRRLKELTAKEPEP